MCGQRYELRACELVLQEATKGLAAGTRVVVGLEHLELVALDQVLAVEDYGRHLLLLDQPSQALGMYAEDPSSLDEVHVVIEGIADHRDRARTSVTRNSAKTRE